MAAKVHHPNKDLAFRAGYGSGHTPLHQSLHLGFVPNFKAKSKSRANSHVMEFLSRVFSNDGASRFFKTFLLRFLFDSSGKSSEDGSARLMPCVTR